MAMSFLTSSPPPPPPPPAPAPAVSAAPAAGMLGSLLPWMASNAPAGQSLRENAPRPTPTHTEYYALTHTHAQQTCAVQCGKRNRPFRGDRVVERPDLVRCYFILKIPSFYQDRLGTDIEKALKLYTMGVSQFSEYRIEAADRNGTVCVQVKRGASLFG
jgi:hypothetical protein